MDHWDGGQRRRWTVALFLGCLLLYATRSTMSISSVAMSKELLWSKEQAGAALAAFFAGYIMTQAFGGYLADRYGGDITIIISASIWASATVLIPAAATLDAVGISSLYGVILGRFVTGASQGVFFPSISSLLIKKVPISHKSSVFSLATSGTDAGSIMSGLAGSLLIETIGWRSVFVSSGVFTLMWLFWLYNLHSASEANKISSKEGDGDSLVEQGNPPRTMPLWSLLTRKPVIALLSAHFFTDMCFFTLLSWLPTYFHDFFPSSKGWLFNVLPWLCSFTTSILSGYLADHLLKRGYSVEQVRKRCVIIALGGASFFSIVLNYIQTFPQALVCMSLIVGLLGFNTCGMLQNPQDLSPRNAGTLFGVMNTFGSIPGIIGVYGTGYVLDLHGDWSLVFKMTSVTSAAACVIFVLFGSSDELK